MIHPDSDSIQAPFAVLGGSGHRFWALATLRAPVLVLSSESGIRVEPFSSTSLREWDDLLTVGRFDIGDPAGLVKRLDGKVPDGSTEDFGLLALASAYAEYNRQNCSDLNTIIDVVEGHGVQFPDLDLIKLAADIASKSLGGSDRRDAIKHGLVDSPPSLPVLRWASCCLPTW